MSNIYTIIRVVADKRADMIIGSILKYVTDINAVKVLGFCVSVTYAKYMSEFFNKVQLDSAVWKHQSEDEKAKIVQICFEKLKE